MEEIPILDFLKYILQSSKTVYFIDQKWLISKHINNSKYNNCSQLKQNII